MPYKIIITSKAKKELSEIPKLYYQKITGEIFALSQTPRPINCKKLKGTINEYRIRIGIYRVLYIIEDKTVTVTIIKIGHRKDVYQ